MTIPGFTAERSLTARPLPYRALGRTAKSLPSVHPMLGIENGNGDDGNRNGNGVDGNGGGGGGGGDITCWYCGQEEPGCYVEGGYPPYVVCRDVYTFDVISVTPCSEVPC